MSGFELPGATLNLPSRFSDVSNAISTGLFDPQGANYTDFLGGVAKAQGGYSLLSSGYGALNPATTPGGSSNPVATATGTDQPSPTEGGSTTPGQTATQAAGVTGTIASYFVRGVIIILGFIFVAVGLAMFSGGREASAFGAMLKGEA